MARKSTLWILLSAGLGFLRGLRAQTCVEPQWTTYVAADAAQYVRVPLATSADILCIALNSGGAHTYGPVPGRFYAISAVTTACVTAIPGDPMTGSVSTNYRVLKKPAAGQEIVEEEVTDIEQAAAGVEARLTAMCAISAISNLTGAVNPTYGTLFAGYHQASPSTGAVRPGVGVRNTLETGVTRGSPVTVFVLRKRQGNFMDSYTCTDNATPTAAQIAGTTALGQQSDRLHCLAICMKTSGCTAVAIANEKSGNLACTFHAAGGSAAGTNTVCVKDA